MLGSILAQTCRSQLNFDSHWHVPRSCAIYGAVVSLATCRCFVELPGPVHLPFALRVGLLLSLSDIERGVQIQGAQR